MLKPGAKRRQRLKTSLQALFDCLKKGLTYFEICALYFEKGLTYFLRPRESVFIFRFRFPDFGCAMKHILTLCLPTRA